MSKSLQLYHPQNLILQRLISSIYFVGNDQTIKNYIVYPHTNCNLSLYKNAHIRYRNHSITIKKSAADNCCAIIANRTNQLLEINIPSSPACEIAINFKPFGIACFSNFRFTGKDNFYKVDFFLEELPMLMEQVFSTKQAKKRVAYIEAFLLKKYQPIPHLDKLIKASDLLSDFDAKALLGEIADAVNMNQKQLNRYFNKYVGCSPAHFRRLQRFRKSINSYANATDGISLTKLAYRFNYADQAYLINEFKDFTARSPKMFFKQLTALANGKILWKVN
jgi:AraC-like DNA-binding protein